MPVMTAENTPPPLVATSNGGIVNDSRPWQVFTIPGANYEANGSTGVWIQIDLGPGGAKRLSRYTIVYAGLFSIFFPTRNVKTWTIQGSNDESDWGLNIIDTQTAQSWVAQFQGVDLVVDANLNTRVTSASHVFDAGNVGNFLDIAGDGWISGFYTIESVSSGAAILDRSPANVGSTSGGWIMKGPVGELNAPVRQRTYQCTGEARNQAWRYLRIDITENSGDLSYTHLEGWQFGGGQANRFSTSHSHAIG